MLLTKWRAVVAVLLAVGALVGGAGTSALRTLEANQPAAEPAAGGEQAAKGANRARHGTTQQARTDNYGDPLPPRALLRMGTVRRRHVGATSAAAFSPDGKLLASGGYDQTIRLWDAATSKEIRRMNSSHLVVWFLAFAPDGKALASAGEDRAVCVWQVATGKLVRRLPSHTDSITWVAFSPDGKLLASASEDRTVRLWEAATGAELRQLHGHDQGVGAAAFSADGKLLASGSWDGTARLWDVATGKTIRRFKVCTRGRNAAGSAWSSVRVAFTPDGKALATSSPQLNPTSSAWECRVRLWDMATGQELEHFPAKAAFDPYPPLMISQPYPLFSHDGRLLAASAGGSCYLWDVATGKKTRRLVPGGSPIGSLVAFSPDDRTLAALGGAAVRLWRVATGKEIHPGGHCDRVSCLAMSPDGKVVASSSRDGTVRLWEAATGNEVWRYRVGEAGRVDALAFSPDGTVLASGAIGEDVVRLHGAATGKVMRQIKGTGSSQALDLAFSPDGRTLAVNDGLAVRLWETATGNLLRKVWDGKGAEPGSHVGFLPDGKRLLVGNHLLDVATGKEIRRFGNEGVDRDRVALAPDGTVLACPHGEDIYVWDVATGGAQRMRTALDVNALALSADGRFLASKDVQSDVLEVREVASGQLCWRARGQPSFAYSPLCFSPDGATLASGSDDSTIVLWDLAGTGRDRANRPGRVRLAPGESELLWQHLGSGDATVAYAGMWRLAADPEHALPFLRERLRAVLIPDGRAARLIADLDSKRFRTREQASAELAKLGVAIEPVLRKVLAGRPSPEVRQRIEAILHQLGLQSLRLARATGVLERIGTPEARQALKALAREGPTVQLKQEARASLERLARRPASPP